MSRILKKSKVRRRRGRSSSEEVFLVGWFSRKKETKDPNGAAGPVDFDALIAAAVKSGDPTAQGPIWKAIYDLPSWHFVGDPQRPTAPVVGIQHGQPAVFVFTDPDHAQRYAEKGRILDEQGKAFHIPMALGQAKSFLAQLAERGVRYIVFNAEPVGLGGDLKQFLAEADRVLQHQIGRFFDDLVKQAEAAGGGEAYSRVWAAVMELPRWHFVGDRMMPDKPYVGTVNDQPAVFAFTDEVNALRFAMKERLQLADGSFSLVSYGVDDAIHRLVEAHKTTGVPQIVFNAESKYFVGFLKDFADIQKLRAEAASPQSTSAVGTGAVPGATPDIDRLAAECRSDGSRESMDRLWRAVYALKQWHFVPRGEMEPNTIRAFVGEVDGKPYVFAFTDDRRAHAFAVRQKLQTSEGAFGILSMQTRAAVNYVHRLGEQGVFGILFNDGPSGFFAPIGNVLPMARYFGLIPQAEQ
jgi:hypothetical protein